MQKINVRWEVLRAEKETSWLAIAKKMNVNRKTLYSMINSKNPTLSTMFKLADAFDVKLSEVIKTIEEKQ